MAGQLHHETYPSETAEHVCIVPALGRSPDVKRKTQKCEVLTVDMATKPNFTTKLASIPISRLAGRRVLEPPVPGVPPKGRFDLLAARVQQFLLFTGMSLSDCSLVLSQARVREFARGQTIYIEGDNLQQVVLLTFGSAKMMQCGEDGSAVIIRLCGPGELVGTLGVTMQEKYRSTSQALTPCHALVWDSKVFESLSCRFPSLRLNVAYILYKLLEDMEDRFREISTERVSCRLARQIVRLMSQVGTQAGGSIEIRITREELAQLIGTSLYTVSRLLADWGRKAILIPQREGFVVSDMNALEALIGEFAEE